MKAERLGVWAQRWQQFVALVVMVNLLLVLFDLTYVPLRSHYLRYAPAIVQAYDPMKGITPHPVTQAYLQSVAKLKQQVDETGLASAATQQVLARLRQESRFLIEENPFLDAEQTRTYAKLKRRLRGYTGALSAQAAFTQLWQTDALAEGGWAAATDFLSQQLEPLLARTYFRASLPTGQLIDQFWRIDWPFTLFFGLDLLISTLWLSRQRSGLSWGDAIARRWYDWPLILPFWRWLRVIPAAVRLHRTNLFNVARLVSQLTHEPVAYLSNRVTKFALVQIINQTSDAITSGTLVATLRSRTGKTVGQPDKLDRIADRLIQVVVLKVMPTVKPDLEGLLRYSLKGALTRSDLYENLRQIPGFTAFPASALDSLSNYLAQAACDVLADSYTDMTGRVLLDRLNHDFRQALGRELQATAASNEIQTLLAELLEEIKLNYVQRLQQENPEQTMEEVVSLDESVGG
ncbi:MAG: hypothetical protein F6J97_24325 [Leptolyngbya sp. SIO4C1]|nr:hypothetical protein [Leptolyngbya sp. SIO4C1]